MNEVKVSELMKVSIRRAERRTMKQATHKVKELDKERGRCRALKDCSNKKVAFVMSESLGDILGVGMHIYLRATSLCRFTVQHRTPKRGALDYCPCRIPAQTWAKL
jgi:hypothetical protein